MTSRFYDKFARADGTIGTNYTVACGGVVISDQAVIPLNEGAILSGFSPLLPGVTAQKTQVFYTAEAMDGPHYVVRGTWAHDGETASELDPPSVDTPNSFTLLARMSKDPLLYDLGTDEDPACYDQGYGARVTMPLDGSAPILKIIKFMPLRRLPGLNRPASTEVDGMVVLSSVTLDHDDLNLDMGFDSTTYEAGDVLPYKGFWQDMRLRIRREDDQVVIDVFLNDRNLNQSKLSYTDRQDPLWGGVGLPGFEFISGTVTPQPAGTSPYGLDGLALVRCGLLEIETFRDVRQAVNVFPGSHYTYGRIVDRVITLVEKNGDARYNATTAGRTKIQTYLDFVLEAEADIIRLEGYWNWLRRESRIYLKDGQHTYELPANCGELELIRPGNWNRRPLTQMQNINFFRLVQGATQSGGQPHTFIQAEMGPDGRQQVRIFPEPDFSDTQTVDGEDPYMVVQYYGRQIRPNDPDSEIPFCPQEDSDVLIYGAAAHAVTLDTDPQNAQRMSQVYSVKLKMLRRKNNRNITNRITMVSAADTLGGAQQTPLTRASSLGSLLYI
tara:strand:+ start:15706 stop:17370 length:1665 start_codon:yes stop_codon:yes gene_type:complete